jgi:hypothetical protein
VGSGHRGRAVFARASTPPAPAKGWLGVVLTAQGGLCSVSITSSPRRPERRVSVQGTVWAKGRCRPLRVAGNQHTTGWRDTASHRATCYLGPSVGEPSSRQSREISCESSAEPDQRRLRMLDREVELGDEDGGGGRRVSEQGGAPRRGVASSASSRDVSELEWHPVEMSCRG